MADYVQKIQILGAKVTALARKNITVSILILQLVSKITLMSYIKNV